MKRGEILDIAKKAISGDRQKSHGDAARNFQHTANLWNGYFSNDPGRPITAKDVAMMNVLQKISRSVFNEKHADHYVDMCGYSALAGDLTGSK